MCPLRILPCTLIVAAVFAQMAMAQFAAPLSSPILHPDRTVTFRVKAPLASEVLVSLEGAERQPLTKGEDGIWSLTTQPLEPDMYGYSFLVDGVSMTDPGNPVSKPNLLFKSSLLHVPGGPELPWEVRDVPRGAVTQHFYRSRIAQDTRDYFVYTPPGYATDTAKRYPVLYLLHGFSDDAGGWTQVGQAHVILDNLIASGQAQPMIVVMPLGYGTMEVVRDPQNAFRDPAMAGKNFNRFRQALLEEVMPMVERDYRAFTDSNYRAIAGLSMGGSETLYTALNYPDKFRYVAAFSFGGLNPDFASQFPKLSESVNEQFAFVWIVCGTEDRLIGINRQFSSWLREKGVKHEFTEMPGAHTWMVWRRNLATVVPRLFQPAGAE
jgi:enterochelin esterase-like enzyme